VDCLLVEKNDFASGTSQATSKLIHGGLRYLKNFELGLVRESLRERKNLAKITPHSIYTLGFAIPLYSRAESMMLHAGMEMYDKLSYDRNTGISDDLVIPKFSHWSKNRAIHEMPQVPRENLNGAFLYYDYANLNPERHTTEFIFAAMAKGAKASHYTEAVKVERLSPSSSNGGEGYRVELLNRITKKKRTIVVKSIVNAAGPWVDIIEANVGIETDKHIVRSKGIHIVTRKICQEHCIVLKKRDKSHLFVIPWRGKTIIGTTDTVYDANPDEFHVTREDILDLIEDVNFAYGDTKLTEKDIDFYYGGMRPLVEDSGDAKGSYNASRKSEVMDHGEAGFPGFFSAMGGKYTTSRAVAESLVDKLVAFLPGNYQPCITEDSPLLGGDYSDRKTLCLDLENKFPKTSGEKIEVLAKRYGSLTEAILQIKTPSKEESFLLSGGEVLYPEEVHYIARNEAIHFATDFFFRRSGAGVPGCPPMKSLDGILALLAKDLKWSPARLKQEKQTIIDRYRF
jgi:glycerol-3-phosphate dehydrogenase